MRWGKFLSATTDEELETLAMNDPVMKQATEALNRLSADPQARQLAEQREMALISYHLDLNKVRAEGKAEGKAELLRKLLTLKFGELPEATARRIASGSEAELELWVERVLTADTLDVIFSR